MGGVGGTGGGKSASCSDEERLYRRLFLFPFAVGYEILDNVTHFLGRYSCLSFFPLTLKYYITYLFCRIRIKPATPFACLRFSFPFPFSYEILPFESKLEFSIALLVCIVSIRIGHQKCIFDRGYPCLIYGWQKVIPPTT